MMKITRLVVALLAALTFGCAHADEKTQTAEKLTWAPPKLENPITVQVSNTNNNLKLNKEKDYIIKMPDTPLTADGGLTIYGGRNVVLIGGEIRHDQPVDKGKIPHRRGVYIKGCKGTVHIEGLKIAGKHLAEGFNIDLRNNNILQLQNIRVEKVHGTREGHHADVVQTWAGPYELRIDHLTGFSTYQGFFLHPNQHFKGPKPKLFDFRNVNVNAEAYTYWQATEFPIKVTNVWANPPAGRKWPELVLWPKGSTVWNDVQRGNPPNGDFVPENAAGVNYKSPGYVDQK